MDRPEILQLSPILVPDIQQRLDALYTVHRLFEQADPEAYVSAHGARMQAVITGGHTGIRNAWLERLPALRVVAVNGVGTDAVELEHCRARGLAVTTTLGALTEDVADLAVGLLIATCRSLCGGDRFVRAGEWVRRPHPSAIPLARRFSGMRIGIVGMGRVGRAVAARVQGFGCYLVNVARGRLVVEADLIAALQGGRIAGAGLDVFADEPHVPPTLFAMDNVTLQAHRASATWETRAAMGEMVLASVAQALAGERPAASLTT